MGYVKVSTFVLTLDCCQSYIGRCQAKEVSTSVKYLFEKFTKVCPTGHAMQLPPISLPTSPTLHSLDSSGWYEAHCSCVSPPISGQVKGEPMQTPGLRLEPWPKNPPKVGHPLLLLRPFCAYPCTISKRYYMGPCFWHRNAVSILHEAMPPSCTESKIFLNLHCCT